MDGYGGANPTTLVTFPPAKPKLVGMSQRYILYSISRAGGPIFWLFHDLHAILKVKHQLARYGSRKAYLNQANSKTLPPHPIGLNMLVTRITASSSSHRKTAVRKHPVLCSMVQATGNFFGFFH